MPRASAAPATSAAPGLPLGCVLAGGQSSRMGRDKAMLLFNGEPLVAHAVHCLREAGCTPRIAGARADGLGRYAPVLADQHPGCGPLAGIESGLAAGWAAGLGAGLAADLPARTAAARTSVRSSPHPVLFLPVDLPLLPPAFLALLLDRAARTGALATVPVFGGRPQPLCAVYHPALLPGIRAALDAGHYKVMRVIQTLTRNREQDFFTVEAVLAASTLPAASPLPMHRWFTNLNSPEDLAALPA